MGIPEPSLLCVHRRNLRIQDRGSSLGWIPACAGMTESESRGHLTHFGRGLHEAEERCAQHTLPRLPNPIPLLSSAALCTAQPRHLVFLTRSTERKRRNRAEKNERTRIKEHRASCLRSSLLSPLFVSFGDRNFSCGRRPRRVLCGWKIPDSCFRGNDKPAVCVAPTCRCRLARSFRLTPSLRNSAESVDSGS